MTEPNEARAIIEVPSTPPIMDPQSPPPPVITPWLLFGGIYVIASLGGIAALLRSKKEITTRMLFSAFLNSGLASVGMAFLLYEDLSLYKLIGTSVLCGVGGVSLVDVMIQGLKPKILQVLQVLFSQNDQDL